MILDSLREETSPLKVLATTWLTHVIQQGDINRVMEPLLQMLLHPDTARFVYCQITLYDNADLMQNQLFACCLMLCI